MRINRRSLIRVVRNTVAERTHADRNLISIYLCGSLLGENYSLGGTVDIDLFFLHTDKVEQEREIVRLTDEVHLDIAHHDQADYRDTRRLRLHPWMGPTISAAEIYFDPGHFMDFTQASVRGQFNSPEHVLQRARTQAESARGIWFAYEMKQPEAGPKQIIDYLQALRNAANAVASLSGPPLTDRRFLLNYPQRAEAVGRPGLHAGLMGLLGAPNVAGETIKSWLPAWEAAYDSLSEDLAPPRLHPVRKLYYLRAFEEMSQGEQPALLLWPLLRTWTQVVNILPQESEALGGWRAAVLELGLLGDGFGERIEALDVYLDQVEETMDDWARVQGIL